MKLKNGKNKNPFLCAFNGIISAFKSEAHVKFDFFVAIIVIVFGFIFRISMMEWIVVILAIGMVIGAELMNTAVETVVDMFTSEYNELAKKAKDVAAGAVLITASATAIIGIIIFLPKLFSLMNIVTK